MLVHRDNTPQNW